MEFTADTIIGMEVHVQLNTASKLFCGCPTKVTEANLRGEDIPNSRCCEVCLGHPGSKPVFNKKVLEYALKLCIALNCAIAKELIFSRKSYFYPDLAKNFQITQYEIPLGSFGFLSLRSGKKIGIKRIHIEEDPASLVHAGGLLASQSVLIDYNRSGIPLLEIVTEPGLTSPEEAREFLNNLMSILRYLEIFDPDSGVIKADANISIKESGYRRVEIKNITGFKEIENALFYEVGRQKKEVKEGRSIILETRGWDSEKRLTYSLRTKETEADYGYIFEPDLVKIDVTKEMLTSARNSIPELPAEKKERYIKEYKLSPDDAEVIAAEKTLAELYERLSKKVDHLLAARWLRKELLRVLNYNKIDLKDVILDEKHVLELLSLMQNKEITDETARRILEKLIKEPFSPKEYVAKTGAKMIADIGSLKKFCEEAIKEAPKAAEDYKKGEEKALNFIVGLVMKRSGGKAKPEEVKKILKELV